MGSDLGTGTEKEVATNGIERLLKNLKQEHVVHGTARHKFDTMRCPPPKNCSPVCIFSSNIAVVEGFNACEGLIPHRRRAESTNLFAEKPQFVEGSVFED